nr:lipopolysaccharide biosynthesis protein [Demequina soli]
MVWEYGRSAITGISTRLSGPGAVALAGLSASAIGLVASPVQARALGPEDRGAVAAVAAATIIVPILLSFGAPLELRNRAASEDPAPLVRAARLASFASLVPAAAVTLILWLTFFSGLSHSTKLAAAMAVAASPVAIAVTMRTSVLMARERFGAVFAIRLVAPVSMLAGLLILLVRDAASAFSVILLIPGSQAIALVVALACFRVGIRGPRSAIWPIYRASSGFAGARVGEIALAQLPAMIALPWASSADAGIYSVAATILAMPIAIGTALGAAHHPRIARDVATQGLNARYADAVRQAIALGLIVTILLLAIVPWAVPLVFGPEFASAVGPAALLSVAAMPLTANTALTAFLGARRQGRAMTVSYLAGVAVLASAWLLPVDFRNALTLAGAVAASQLVVCVVMLVAHGDWRGIAPRRQDYRESLVALAGRQ